MTITMADRGPGIPGHRMNEIFEPFVRISGARERESGGHGLGLAIARRAVEAHGGSIRAENRQDGGLSVLMRVPVIRS